MDILSIGCGNMGAAILNGILRRFPETQISVIDPNVEMAKSRLPNKNSVTFHDNLAEIGERKPDLVLLAIKPQQLEEVAAQGCKQLQNTLLISILAGKSSSAIGAALKAPQTVRVMPNLPAKIGQGMSVGYGGTGAISAKDKAFVEQIFQTVGKFVWVADETVLDVCTAISGSGPGFVFSFAQHLEDAAAVAGMPNHLLRLIIAQTLFGSASLLNEDDRSISILKGEVTSSGGTTEAGLQILDAQNGFPLLIERAVNAAVLRAQEL